MQHAILLLEDSLRNEITPLVEALGFSLVEVRVIKTKGNTTVRVIIDSARGVGVEDCAAVSRALHPRLELREDLGDFSLEISSPGIGRVLKRLEEYRIFTGRPVAVLLHDESEWRQGVIHSVENEHLILTVKDRQERLPFDRIKRTKLILGGEEEE